VADKANPAQVRVFYSLPHGLGKRAAMLFLKTGGGGADICIAARAAVRVAA
jgi:hypothetical protein